MREQGGVSPEGDVDALVSGACRALGYALDRPGRDREAAFALLASDGLLTLAVERHAEAEDPEKELRAVMAAVSAVREGGTG